MDSTQHVEAAISEDGHPGRVYRALFARCIGAAELFEASSRSIGGDEQAWLGKQQLQGGAALGGYGFAEERARDVAKSIFRQLIRIAEERFAPPGAKLSIANEEFKRNYLDPYLFSSGDPRKFDPVALWDALDARFGAGQGAELAYRQAARKLGSFFGLHSAQPIERRGGWVIIRRSVCLDAFFGSYSYNFREDLTALVPAVLAFAAWGKEDEFGAGFAAWASEVGKCNRKVQSRERFGLGPRAEVVTYKSQVEFRFDAALAGQLQVFASRYLPRPAVA